MFRTRNVGVALLVITTNLLGLIQLANLNSLRAGGALLCVASTYYWWFTSCISNSDASATVRVLAKSFSALVLADAITEGASWFWLEWSANVDWTSAVSLTLVLAPCLCPLAGLPFWHAALFTVASVVCRLLVVRSIAATFRSRVLLVPFVGFLSASFAAVLAVSEKNVMEDESVSGVVASAEIDNRKLVEMRPKLQRRRHTASTLPTHAPSSGLDVATIIEAHGLLEEAIAGAPHVLKSRLESIAKLLATQAPAMNLNPNQDMHPLVLTSTLPSDCNGDDENDDCDEAASVHSAASSIRHRRNRHGTFTTVTDPMGLPQWEAQPTELRSRASTLQFRRGTRANRDSPLVDVFWKRSKSDGSEKTKKTERWTPRILSLSANGRERSRSVDYSSSHFNGISERRASSSSPVEPPKLLTGTERVASVLEETVEKENCDYDEDEDDEDDDDDENDGIFFPAPPLAIGQLLKSIEDWNFEIFKLAELSSDHVLSVLASHVFVKSGLTETFRLPSRKFAAYFQAIESGYHEDNSYHNRIHAADVLHASYYLITSPVPGFATNSPLSPIDSGVGEGSGSSSTQADSYEETSSFPPIDEDSSPLFIAFPPLEVMALLIAAAIHDYDHPGRTNAFLVATTHELAVLYNDYSVLENHHVASAWKLLLSSERFNFLQHLEAAELKRLRYLVVELVLSTDLKKHFDILANFSAKCDSLDWSSEQDRLLVLQMIIKMADINTPAKPHPIQVRWTELISREFYAQGDDERRLGMPVEQFMDRDDPNLSRLQVGFIRNLVAPLYNGFSRVGLLPGRRERIVPDCAPGDDSAQAIEADSAKSEAKCRFVSPLLENLQENFNIWEERVLEEQIAADKERFRFIAKTAALKALKRMGLDAVAEDVISTRINNATE